MEANVRDLSQCFSTSQHAVPSPDGALVATVVQSQLTLRSTSNGKVTQTFPIPRGDIGPYRFLRWSAHRSTFNAKPLRILLANDDTIHVFEIKNAQWKAVIRNAAGSQGNIAHVDFGADENEIVVYSDFGVKVTIWSLISSRGVELRDPKTGPKCYDYRPETKHWAILSRELAHDSLLILAPGTYEVLENVELPTVDAQGVKWSPDGRWLATWDTTSAGYGLLIYTADGNLFKTYAGGQTADAVGLGIKNVAWSPNGEYLAVGDYEDRVMLLKNNTFSPAMSFALVSSITPDKFGVWEEQIQNSQARSYLRAIQPSTPPSQSSLLGRSDAITGVSLMEFNVDGTLLAARSDSTPSTLWIWSSKSRAPMTVLVHHAAIRSIHWHPTIVDLILIHCALESPIIHLWSSNWKTPKILDLTLDKTGGRMEASWLFTEAHEHCRLLIGNAQNYAIALVNADGELMPQTKLENYVDSGPDDRFDESLMDFSPVKLPHNDLSSGIYDDSNGLEDTFQFKRSTKLMV